MICKIFRHFVNPLSVDNKYSVLNKGNLLHHFQMELSQTWKIFSRFFFSFTNFKFNFEHFEKKVDSDSWCILELTDSDGRGLDKYLKSGVLEDPSTSDMENGPKHSSKLNDSTFTIFIDPCEDNSAGKSFSELYAKP